MYLLFDQERSRYDEREGRGCTKLEYFSTQGNDVVDDPSIPILTLGPISPGNTLVLHVGERAEGKRPMHTACLRRQASPSTQICYRISDDLKQMMMDV